MEANDGALQTQKVARLGEPLSFIFHRTKPEQSTGLVIAFYSPAQLLHAFWKSMQGEGQEPETSHEMLLWLTRWLIDRDSDAGRDGGPSGPWAECALRCVSGYGHKPTLRYSYL